MSAVTDRLIDLALGRVKKELEKSVGKAAAYYDTHLKLLKDSLKGLEKKKKMDSEIKKIEASLLNIKRGSFLLVAEMPKKLEWPKEGDKKWGKANKCTSFKDAQKAYMDGLSVAIVQLNDYIAKAEATRANIKDEAAKYLKASQDAQAKKGAWAKIESASLLDGMQQVININMSTGKEIDKIISAKKAQRTKFRNHMKNG
ncbi:hypothetical protein [Tateyamaria sp.]|uniref:hypothetical protein n=1 Tax=Tateyamaria sp. TaxID=1929288 RepID=UPI00329B186B